MFVIVNGERTEVSAATVSTLLEEMDFAGRHLAVAVNHRVVPRVRWAETALNSGDEIEIITPRQGG